MTTSLCASRLFAEDDQFFLNPEYVLVGCLQFDKPCGVVVEPESFCEFSKRTMCRYKFFCSINELSCSVFELVTLEVSIEIFCSSAVGEAEI